MPIPDRTFTRAEVAESAKKLSAAGEDSDAPVLFIIDTVVYDVADFLDAHPGGAFVLRQVAGTDATEAFYNLHRQEVIERRIDDLAVGSIAGETPAVLRPAPGALSRVPYAEPLWVASTLARVDAATGALVDGFQTPPYYKDSHRRLQRALRVFVDRYVAPEAREKERSGEHVGQPLIDRMAHAGILHMRLGPGKHLHGVRLLRDDGPGGHPDGVMDGADFDYFHDLLTAQEFVRPAARGFQDGNLAGLVIGLTVVLHYANDAALQARVLADCLSGRKKICLAITEAFAGSDVARLRTTAVKAADGSHYVLNGTKKWITNGVFCDYFVVACQTDRGMSVLLVERGEGVATKAIKTSYSAAAGTTFVTFDNVRVPAAHLLGQENKGIYVVLANFNHERWTMVCAVTSYCRLVVEECLKWAHQRQVFAKRLIDQPVIRLKLAKMIALVEAHQAWLEAVTFQMCSMPHAQQAKHLGGPIGLLKMSATRMAHEIADEAVQIWGGRGLTQTGMGRVIENFNRTYKFDAILGGAEEVLGDLGVRQAMKFMPKAML